MALLKVLTSTLNKKDVVNITTVPFQLNKRLKVQATL